jgi:hypothetical protein
MPTDETDEDASLIGLVDIDPSGDVVIIVSDSSHEPVAFRLSIARLRSSSRYFSRLFEPSKFSEGHQAEQKLAFLRERYGDAAKAPVAQIPRVRVSDLGRIGRVSSIEGLMSDFFNICYGKDTSARAIHMPLANLANLTVVADRFDALEPLQRYIVRLRLPETIDARLKPSAPWVEERARMKTYVGYLLKHHPWLKESHGIIIHSSKMWLDEADLDGSSAWWDIPGLEGGICQKSLREVGTDSFPEEMEFRRSALLQTIGSLQPYFLSLYMSPAHQCISGYSNTRECDQFQLGEMVKFFARLGTLNLESTLAGLDPEPPSNGDVMKLLGQLRQCPSYQIDSAHSHCGLRDRILPCLEFLSTIILERKDLVGICGECWAQRRTATRWIGAKGPLIWHLDRALRDISRFKESSPSCHESQAAARDLFLANDRQWTEVPMK